MAAENERREPFLALIAGVRDGTAEAKSVAAAELSQLAAVGTDNQVLIASLGGISALIALIRNGSPEGKGNAADAFRFLARNDDNAVLIAREGGIPPLIALVRDGSAEGKAKAAGALRNLSSIPANSSAMTAAGYSI